jgi:hypothetical protein
MSAEQELRTLLARVRRRWFELTFLATFGRAAGAAAVPLFAAALAGSLLRPSGAALVILALLTLGTVASAAFFVFVRMQRRPDDCRVARFIEERCSDNGASSSLSDALVSAIRVVETPDKHPGAFATLIVANAVKVLRHIDPADVVSRGAMRRAGLEASVGAIIFISAVAAGHPDLLRAGATAWVWLLPQSVEIAVLPGDARVPAGQGFRIAATVRGRGATLLGVVPSLIVSASGQQRAVEMIAASTGFAYTFDSIDRSFQYRVAAGSTSTRSFSVTALFPPRVKRIDVHYEYPTFTGQRPRTEEDGGDIYGPAGTRVRLLVHTDRPARSGELALADSRTISLNAAPDGTVSADLVVTKDDAYRVRLTDQDGLQSSGEVEYFIRLMDDRPPDVRIVRPAADQGITPLEEVAIEARADDDYGVAHFDLVYAVPGKPARIVPFSRVTGTEVAKVGTHLLAAEELGVQPGDVITYYARARDVARGKRPTETRSDIFFLEVKPFNEEFVAAQSQGMAGAASGTQIDSLIAAQKEIISATWNLERRSSAGRSAADMKALGQAQAELKARTEQLMRGNRRASPELFAPQQIGLSRQGPPRRGATESVSAAVDAMGRAVEHLERARTAEAIPHEMQALQGLLQAQAEVRRRQVMQQSSSSAGQGGTSRTDRDLSALFDRELQRQQRTNYETSQSAQSPQPEDTGDALDRIRDLARRQEELARRQREVANAQQSEERKRLLEQLTREQQELRGEAEALEKKLQSGRADAARTGQDKTAQGSKATDRTENVRRAAEEMRNAASEMQRENAQGAAASSEKAAEALRQTERQMRGGSADARQRAAGELQLEAQQVADAQRRIAAEVSRLEKEGTQTNADTDGLRRLAGEKDKLADRVEELQRAVRELERQTPGAEGAPLRDAAQPLQGQRIGERMRSTAKEMRERAAAGAAGRKPATKEAQAEQQLSRTLDSVVDALGGNTEARRLSDQLDRTREIRDRLNRLEQQVRDAEKNAANPTQTAGVPTQSGRDGRTGRQPGSDGSSQQQLQRARDEYARELERSREGLSRLQSSQQPNGLGGSTPEHHEYSRSSPGNESFKQDFSGWERLRKDIDVRLEQYESAVAARLARKLAEDRLSAGGSDRVPDAYRPSVSRYFESLAKGKQ